MSTATPSHSSTYIKKKDGALIRIVILQKSANSKLSCGHMLQACKGKQGRLEYFGFYWNRFSLVPQDIIALQRQGWQNHSPHHQESVPVLVVVFVAWCSAFGHFHWKVHSGVLGCSLQPFALITVDDLLCDILVSLRGKLFTRGIWGRDESAETRVMKRAAPGSDLRKKIVGVLEALEKVELTLKGSSNSSWIWFLLFIDKAANFSIAFVGQGPKSMNTSFELNICKFQTIYLHLGGSWGGEKNSAP